MRGNVPTRVRKLARGGFDATVLAVAGLLRLGVEGLDETVESLAFEVPPGWDEVGKSDDAPLAGTIVYMAPLSAEVCLPAVGQGALCLEARKDRPHVLEILSALDDTPSRAEILCERAVMRTLEGGCQVPIAAWARMRDGELQVDAAVASVDGSHKVMAQGSAPMHDAVNLGQEVAHRLRAQGATEILAALRP
jgi:hydroxymethylbilane synthase